MECSDTAAQVNRTSEADRSGLTLLHCAAISGSVQVRSTRTHSQPPAHCGRVPTKADAAPPVPLLALLLCLFVCLRACARVACRRWRSCCPWQRVSTRRMREKGSPRCTARQAEVCQASSTCC